MLVNPYDPDKVAESIHSALAMPVRMFVGVLSVRRREVAIGKEEEYVMSVNLER